MLLEYKMEGLDAEATAFHIKQRFPEVPIALLSADRDPPNFGNASRFGGNCFDVSFMRRAKSWTNAAMSPISSRNNDP